LIIVGDDPSECSHAVLIMLSILAPMRTNADYRPYLTLYESDVKEFQARSKKSGSIGNSIIGVSNPFLVSFFGGEGNAVLHMDRAHFSEKKYQSPKDTELTSKCVKVFNGKFSKEIKHAFVLPPKTSNGNKLKLYLKPSRIALRHLNLDKSVEESLAINNWILRKHFKEMTETFLRAFDPYLRVNYAVRGTGDPQ